MPHTVPPAAPIDQAGRSFPLSRAGERWVLIVLSFFMMVAPAATDMYLPALPVVTHDLGTSSAQVQLSVSYFFLGFGLGQLFWGPLSDRIGRRPPLLAGIVLFIAAGLAAGAAHTIDQMLIARFMQAVGGSAMTVIAQAMARDAWGRQRSAQALSMMLLIMGIAPLLAPIIGAQILRLTSWRAVFWALAVFGVIGLLMALRLPETRPRAARAGVTARAIAGSYLHLLRDVRYVGYTLTSTAVWAGLYVYVAGAPLLYMQHGGLTPQMFSLFFAMNIAGLIVTNFTNTRLLRLRQPPDRMLRAGVAGNAAVNTVLGLAACLGWLPLPLLATLLFMFMALRGFINSNAMAGALANHPQHAGTAAALMGALQCVTGFAAGAVMSAFSDGTPRPMLLVMAALGLTALALMATLLKSRHEVIEMEV